MKIAIPYKDGEVFGHFGHSEQFKVYEIENGEILSSEIIGTDGNGHEALAGLLAEKGVGALICGGIGRGAEQALTESGIALFSGVSGDADEAVHAFLRGELGPAGANCDHHEEEHACGEGSCGESCGAGGCGGCSGCHPAPQITGKNAGKKCKTHYRGTFNDGTQFDSSYDRGEPLEFVCGAGMMIRGFDTAVADMEVGEIRNVHLTPDEAYGEKDPLLVFTVPISNMPGSEELSEGEQVYLRNTYGQPFPARVLEKTALTITFDANHEMAGKELNFTIELVEVSEA